MGTVLLGAKSSAAQGAPRLLLLKARIDSHEGEASAPAQGPMALGAVARQRGWDVRCIDSYLVSDPEQAVQQALREFPAQVIGISALTAESPGMHRLAQAARRAAPDAIILAGGAH